MPACARVDDTITPVTASEHGGHYDEFGAPIHSSVTITGKISSGSPNVFVNGKPKARVGDTTSEIDSCTNGSGVIASGSSKVFVNGKAAARVGSNVTTHVGSTTTIASGSSNVNVG